MHSLLPFSIDGSTSRTFWIRFPHATAFVTVSYTHLLEVTDKDDKFIRDTNLTGTAFFEKYVGLNLDDYVSLINAPTADKPYHRSYSVKFLGNVKEGCPVRYLNLPIEELKKLSLIHI